MAIVMFFAIAVTLYFIMNGISNDLLDFVRNDIINQDEIIQIIEEKEELIVSGEEILSDIMTGDVGEFTLEANGTRTNHTVGNPLAFEGYSYIDMSALYTAIPEFDRDGNVVRMKYIQK